MRLVLLALAFTMLFNIHPNEMFSCLPEPAHDQLGFSEMPPVLSFVDGKIIKKNNNQVVLNSSVSEPDSKVTINYEGCVGFQPQELDYIKNFVEGGGPFSVGMLDCIEMVFGKAFFPITVNFHKTDAGKSRYDSQLQTIYLGTEVCNAGEIFKKIEILAHELIHAHSDVLMKPINCYEEGLAVAQTDLAGSLFCQFNGINGRVAEVFDGPPIGTRDYDLLNQEAASAANGFFWTTPDLAYRRAVNASERYKLAGTAWWKIWRETVPGNISAGNPETFGTGSFFVDFNKEYYQTFKSWVENGKRLVFDLDVLKLVKLQIRRILVKDKGDPFIEGQDFDDWFDSQHILNILVNEGPKLFISQYWQPTNAPSGLPWDVCGFANITYFYTDSLGNENPLNGTLKVEVSSLSLNDYGQSLSCQARHAFWYSLEPKPTVWQEFEIENGQVATMTKTASTSGSIDFSQISRRGCKITFTASTADDLYQVKKEMYFPVKAAIPSNSYLCYGVLDAPKFGMLKCERSSMQGVKQTIPINGDGTYATSFGPADILTFTYTTIDEASGIETTEEITVITGTREMIKNLVFR